MEERSESPSESASPDKAAAAAAATGSREQPLAAAPPPPPMEMEMDAVPMTNQTTSAKAARVKATLPDPEAPQWGPGAAPGAYKIPNPPLPPKDKPMRRPDFSGVARKKKQQQQQHPEATPVEDYEDWDSESEEEEAPPAPPPRENSGSSRPPPISVSPGRREDWSEWDSPSQSQSSPPRAQEELEVSEESDWDAESDGEQSVGREDMLLLKYETLLTLMREHDGDVGAVPEGFFEGLSEEEVDHVFEAVQQDLDAEPSDDEPDAPGATAEVLNEKYEALLQIMIEHDGDPSAVPEGFFEGLAEDEIEEMFDQVEVEMEARADE